MELSVEACPICELLPREVRCDGLQSLPEGFARLEPSAAQQEDERPATDPPAREERRCPECGTIYDLQYTTSGEPTERPRLELQLSRRIESPRWEELEHPIAYRRTDAAYGLARQACGPELSRLLGHPAVEVREHALHGLLSLASLPPELELDPLLHDPEATPRALAARLRWRQLKETPRESRAEGWARDLDSLPVDATALLLGYVVHSEELDRQAFAPFIERAAAHPDTELRKRAARGLAWLAEGGCDQPARIQALLQVMLNDPEWEVRLSGLSALSSMVGEWGEQTPQVLEALSQALRDSKLRYTLFRAMAAVIDRHDISVCLPSLIEIVLHDRTGYSDDASRLICRALEKGLDRRQLVTELLPGLELADEGERGSVCVCYRTMIKRGWDLRPAYDAIFRRLTSSKASFVECDLAADLASPLLSSARREDAERLDSLLNASAEVAGAVTRALASLGRQGRSLSAVVPSLQALLNGPEWVAQGARQALSEHAKNAGRR
jgi:hypothetical protein